MGTGVTDDDDDSGDDGLSVGAIVGIIISAAVVALGGGYSLLKVDAIHIHCCRD